jgi:hypothetical protein
MAAITACAGEWTYAPLANGFLKNRGGVMRTGPLLHEVRSLVIGIFNEFGGPIRESDDLNETIVISEGRYVGRSYRTERLCATWMIADGVIQFQDTDGRILQTVNLFRRKAGYRLAA